MCSEGTANHINIIMMMITARGETKRQWVASPCDVNLTPGISPFDGNTSYLVTGTDAKTDQIHQSRKEY
jgi:hypothetical protein